MTTGDHEEEMSKKMFERIERLMPSVLVEVVEPEDKKTLDDEFERVTGKECDEAAQEMSDHEFEEAVRRAIEALRRRKRKAAEWLDATQEQPDTTEIQDFVVGVYA